MNFRSFEDMAAAVRRNLPRLPHSIDLVVGVPRSGLTPALMIALHRNTMVTDLEGFLGRRAFSPGGTRQKRGLKTDPATWSRILVVDDSVASGSSMATARSAIEGSGFKGEVFYCAVYGLRPEVEQVDLVLETCPLPRVFEWNLFHHPEHMAAACLDIDGVLCVDPTHDENDDGERYTCFLGSTLPRYVPTVPVGTLVTSRLERYRAETEDWLAGHGIEYGELRMLDLSSAAERRRLGAHAPFKAEVYRSLKASSLFVESELPQAEQIAALSGKAVICTDGMIFFGESLRVAAKRKVRRGAGGLVRRLVRKLA